MGADIDPVEVAPEDVEMEDDEEEEPLEQDVSRARMNDENPKTREKHEYEDSGHAVYNSWCTACVEGRGVW